MMNLLATVAQPLGFPGPEQDMPWYEAAWEAIGLGGRISLVVVGVALTFYLLFLFLRRLGRGGRRGLLLSFTLFAGLSLVGLGAWTLRLPEQQGSYFVFWHQLVRAGAAVSATLFVVGFMVVVIPPIMNRLEGRGFVPYVATRHVRASKSGFLTVISFLSIAGVGISSFALCFVVSVMGGFGADLKRKILGNNAHIRVASDNPAGFADWRNLVEEFRLVEGVQAVTPVASGNGIAASTSNRAGVQIRGVDPVTIGSVIDLGENIEVGKLDYLMHPEKLTELPPDEAIGVGPGGEQYFKGPSTKSYSDSELDTDVRKALKPPDLYPGLIVGRELAKSLHVYVGDEVTLVSPIGNLTPAGIMPRAQRFRIAGIFYSGMYEYDASHAYMRLERAQDFLDLEHHITSIDIKVDNAEAVAGVRQRVAASTERKDLRIRDWKEMNRSLFSALKLEKIATFIILSIAIAVASFCIICTLLLMVTEKSKEIAILKALGASDNAILRIFMTEGIMIGGIGTVFGVVTGLVTTLGLLWFGVRLDPDVYYVDRLPIAVDAVDYSIVAISALAITTLATIYPAVAASRLRPVDGIRYE